MSKSSATTPELRHSAISGSFMVECPDDREETPTPEDIPITIDHNNQLLAGNLQPIQGLRRAKTPVPPGDRSLRPESPMPPVLSPPPLNKSVPFPAPKPPPKRTSPGGKSLRRLHRFSLPKNDASSQLQVLSLSQSKSDMGHIPKAQKLGKMRRWQSMEPHMKSKRFSKQESWSTKSTSTEPKSSDSDFTSFLPMLPVC